MANDGMNIRLENGILLDKILSKMQQRIATKIVNQGLSKGAAELRKQIKKDVPKGKKDAEGHVKYQSRNHTKGTLRKSVKSGLRKKVNVGRNTFLAGVWFDNTTGWYAPMATKKYKGTNAFGRIGGTYSINKSISAAKGTVRKAIGDKVAENIAKEGQKEINSRLK